MNDPSVRLQFQKCLQTVQDHDDTMKKQTQATQQDSPQHTYPSNHTMEHTDLPPSKHTTMLKETHPSSPYMYDTLQLLFLTTHYENINDYIDEFPLYTVPQYITQRSILVMIIIYTVNGTTPPHAVQPRRPKKQTNASSHAAPPRMILQLRLHLRLFLPLTLTPAPHIQLILILMPS